MKNWIVRSLWLVAGIVPMCVYLDLVFGVVITRDTNFFGLVAFCVCQTIYAHAYKDKFWVDRN